MAKPSMTAPWSVRWMDHRGVRRESRAQTLRAALDLARNVPGLVTAVAHITQRRGLPCLDLEDAPTWMQTTPERW